MLSGGPGSVKDGGVGVLPASVCKNRALMRQLGKGEVGGREGEGGGGLPRGNGIQWDLEDYNCPRGRGRDVEGASG